MNISNLYSRLTIRARLRLILIAFLVPISWLIWNLYKELDADIKFAQREIAGIAYQKPLATLLDEVADYQISVKQAAAGSASAKAAAADSVIAIDDAFKAAEQAALDFGEFNGFSDDALKADKQTNLSPEALKGLWAEIQSNPQSDALYADLSQRLVDSVMRAGDKSSLILDPELDSYYLVDVTINAVPQTLQQISLIKATGYAAGSGNGSQWKAHSLALIEQTALLEKVYLKRIRDGLRTTISEDKNNHGISKTLQERIPKVLEDYDQGAMQLLDTINKLVNEKIKLSSDAFIEIADVPHDEAAALAVAALEELNILLDTRISDLRELLIETIIVSVSGALVAIGFFFTVATSISSPIAKLRFLMDRIAIGETDVDIERVDSADEISMLTNAAYEMKLGVLKSFQLAQMLDNLPFNVMFADARDNFKLTYCNQASLTTLRGLEQYLPRKVDDIPGSSFDIFHKDPSHQRRMLSDPSRLPHRGRFKIGPETVGLTVTAINDKYGNYIGPMASWEVISSQVAVADNFEKNVMGVVGVVGRSAKELSTTAESMVLTAQSTSKQAIAVASTSTEAAANVQAVAAATEQLSASITEIARQVRDATIVAEHAAKEAALTNEQMSKLSENAKDIGQVLQFIDDIASQTSLLALNATIEAARAGEAGKGFAVVASEVKNLATQTGNATGRISERIEQMQASTNSAVAAIQKIVATIERIDTIQKSIAHAVDEQRSGTAEIARNVSEASTGTNDVTRTITEVTEASSHTGEAASMMMNRASELATNSDVLTVEVQKFLEYVRAA